MWDTLRKYITTRGRTFSMGKYEGKEVPDEEDELLLKLAERQLKADYRRSLGKEFERRYLDAKIKELLKKKTK